MISEFVIRDISSLYFNDLKGFHWVKKRSDMISLFTFNHKEKKRVEKRLKGRYPFEEYKVEPFNQPIPLSESYTFDGLVFSNSTGKGAKKAVKISTLCSFGFDHSATLLTLQMISKYRNFFTNKRILDIGCGSGILSIYMLKRGCRKAYAVDIDPFIVKEAMKNAKRNGFAKNKLYVAVKDVSSLKRTFDFIVANVPINVHSLISEELKRLLIKGGIFLAGGFFNSKLDEIKKFYEGLNFVESTAKEDWAVAVFENK
ncbi:MAG: hypothetical protein OHK0040_10660 [bacterium]